MMLLLNIGYIYAFIPIVVIIILILAARGSIGRDFFQTFGLGQLTDMTAGIGGGGAGKGIQGRNYSASDTRKKIRGPSWRIANALFKRGRTHGEQIAALKQEHSYEYGGYKPGYGPDSKKPDLLRDPIARLRYNNRRYKYSQWGRGDIWKETNNAKSEMLKAMNDAELKGLLLKHNVWYKANGLTSKSEIERVAANELSLGKIESYFNSTTARRAPPGAPAGLTPPRKVRMSIGDAYNYTFGPGGFYDRYERMRSRKVKRDFAANQPPGQQATTQSSAQQAPIERKPGPPQSQLEIKSVKDVNEDNFHTALGLPQRPSDFRTARKAYINLAKKLHPDVSDPKAKVGNEEKFKIVQAAYEAAKKHYKKG